jgi:hypothetical protein
VEPKLVSLPAEALARPIPPSRPEEFAHADYNGIVLEISLWFSPPHLASFE